MADEIVSGLRGIKNELKQVQDRMVGLSAGSDEFVKLSQKAGELRDRMKDVKEAVNSNAGPAIESFGNNLGIAQGQLMSLDLEGFGDSMKRMAGNVKAVDFKSFKDGLSSIGDGLASLGRSLLSNPIFWIAGAIAGAVAAINYFNDQEQDRIKRIEEQRQRDLANYKKDNELRIIQANGSAEQIYKIRMEELNREMLYHAAILKVAKESHDQKIALSDTWKAKEAESQQKYNDLRIEMEKLTQERLNALSAKRVELDKQYSLIGLTERQKTYKLIQDEYNEALRQLGILGASAEDIQKLNEVYREKRRKIDEAYAKEDEAKAKENKDKEEKAQKEKIDRRKALSDFNANQDAEDYQMALEQTEQMSKLGQDLTDQERERAIEKLDIAKTAYQLLDGYDKVFVSQQLQRADEASQKQIELERKVQQSKLEIAVQYLNAAQSLTDAMTTSGLISAEKSFKISKALSITQTTISTIMGVQNALNAATTVPDPFGFPLKVANAVAIGAAGAASIAKIAASQFNPGGGGGGGGLDTPTMPSPSGGGAMSAPSSQSPSALNLSFLQGNVNAAPLQTYVLAGQVSNAQQAEFKIKNTASILGGG
jgi:hypothetical protein